MNLLPIALTFLMLIAIMTTFRLQQFLLTSGVMTEAACIMQKVSRLYDNRIQIGRYERQHVSSDKNKDEETPEIVKASSSLHLAIFSNSTFAKTNAQYVPAYRRLLDATTQIVYARQEFFQQALQEQPSLIESLWDEVSRELEKKEESKDPIKHVEDLANIKLQDPDLQKVWEEMFVVRYDPKSLRESCKGKGEPKELPTILKFLQARGNGELELRIQLLPRELLLALFQDEITVENIMHERYALYKQVINADEKARKTIKDQATEQFKEHFKGALPPDFPPDKANFKITGTRPPK